jgi:hypothetical protein
MLMILLSLFFGVVLGQSYVWVFSASNVYKKIVKDRGVSVKRIRLALTSKVASLILTLIEVLSFTIILGASRENSLINLVIFAATTVVSAIVIWKLLYKKSDGL